MKLFISALALFLSVTAHAENIFTGIESTLTGDGYYSYNFNAPAELNDGTAGNGQTGYRAYDDFDNAFSINSVSLTIGKKLRDFSFFTEFDFGHQPEIVFGNNLAQGYLTFTPASLGGWNVEVGQFITHMGREDYHADKNWNYSRSLTHRYGGPAWHRGVRFIGPDKGALTTNFYFLNGDGQAAGGAGDNNHSKTIGAQLNWSQSADHKFTYNLLYGPEKDDDNSDNTVIHDFIADLRISSQLLVGAEFLMGSTKNDRASLTVDGSDDTSKWSGLTASLKYTMNDNLYFSPRIEFYKANQDTRQLGLTAGGPISSERVTSLTLTLGQKIYPGLDARYEFRHDKSNNDNAFLDGSTTRKDSQTVASVALLFAI
jgi:hypothetical protein